IRGTVRRSLLGSVALEDARLHQGTELAGGSSRTDVGQVAVRRVAKAPTGEGQLEGRGSSGRGFCLLDQLVHHLGHAVAQPDPTLDRAGLPIVGCKSELHPFARVSLGTEAPTADAGE